MTDVEVRVLRASEMDDLFECTPSVVGDGGIVRIRSAAGEPAKLGKIVHALAASYIDKGTFDVRSECNRRDYDDEEEVSRLMYYVAQAWDELRRYFKKPATERVLKGPTIETPTGAYRVEGTVDVCGQDDVKRNTFTFTDWKSGRVDGGYANQMFAYAYLLWNFAGRPDDIAITGVVVFLRHRYFRVAKYDAAALKGWEFDLIHNCLSRLDTFRPGGHCVECPAYHTCAAQKTMTQGTMTALMLPTHVPADDPHRLTITKGLDILASITPDNKSEPEVQELVAGLLARRALGQKLLDDLGEQLRAVVRRVGALPTGGTHALAIRPVQVETLDPVKAHGVLKRKLSDAEILNSCRMSYPKIRAAVVAKFGRGEKKTAREALESELREAGAVSVTEQERLEEVDLGTEQKHVEQSPAEGNRQLEAGPGCSDRAVSGRAESELAPRRVGDEGA